VHCRVEKFFGYKAIYDEAAKDRHGVTISLQNGLDFDIVEVPDARVGVSRFFAVKMTEPTSKANLVACRWQSSISSLHLQTPYVGSCLSAKVISH